MRVSSPAVNPEVSESKLAELKAETEKQVTAGKEKVLQTIRHEILMNLDFMVEVFSSFPESLFSFQFAQINSFQEIDFYVKYSSFM